MFCHLGLELIFFSLLMGWKRHQPVPLQGYREWNITQFFAVIKYFSNSLQFTPQGFSTLCLCQLSVMGLKIKCLCWKWGVLPDLKSLTQQSLSSQPSWSFQVSYVPQQKFIPVKKRQVKWHLVMWKNKISWFCGTRRERCVWPTTPG